MMCLQLYYRIYINKLTLNSNNFNFKKKGDLIGEYEFFSGEHREQSAKAITVTCVAFINKQDFLETLKEFPLDQEKFQMIQDNCVFSTHSKIDFRCYGCYSFKHKLIQCPQVFYQAPKEKIIKALQLSLPQIRLRMNRRPNRFQKALQIQKYSEEMGLLIQQSIAYQQADAKMSQVFDNPTKNFITQTSNVHETQNNQTQQEKKKNQKIDFNLPSSKVIKFQHQRYSQNFETSQNTNVSINPESQNVSQNVIPYINEIAPLSKERKMSILITKKTDQSDENNGNNKEIIQPFSGKKLNVLQFSSLVDSKYRKGGSCENPNEEPINHFSDRDDIKTESSNINNDSLHHSNLDNNEPNHPIIRWATNPKIRVKSGSITSFGTHSLRRIKTVDNDLDFTTVYQKQDNVQLGQSLFILDQFEQGKDFEIYFPFFNRTPTIARVNQKRRKEQSNKAKLKNSKTQRTKLIKTQQKIKKMQTLFRIQQKGSIVN